MKAKRMVLVILGILASAVVGVADWPDGGETVCNEYGDQKSPSIVSLSDGSFITAWQDHRYEPNAIYAQMMDHMGSAIWNTNGVIVCGSSGEQSNPYLISDGSGGCVVFFMDNRNENYGLYGQRLSNSGAPLWNPSGVAISDQCQYFTVPHYAAVSSSPGYYYIAYIGWHDSRIQCVDVNGYAYGPVDGVVYWDDFTDSVNIDCDDNDNVYVVYGDNDTYVCSYDNTLTQRWSALVSDLYSCYDYDIANVGGDELIIVSCGGLASDTRGVYINKVDTSGDVKWGAVGIVVSQHYGASNYADVAIMTTESVIYILYDYESYYTVVGYDRDGAIVWPAVEIPEHIAAGNLRLATCTDDALVIVDGGTAYKVDASGNLVWGVDGRHYAQGGTQFNITDNNDGGIYSVFSVSNSPSVYDVYAQRLLANGYRCEPAPLISSIYDYPGDQGSWLILDLLSSCYDRSDVVTMPIEGYNVWRRMDESVAKAGVITDGEISCVDCTGTAVRANGESDFPPGSWISIGYHASADLEEYSLLVPTDADSSSSGAPFNTYAVTAHTSGPYFVSIPDSGYSVDNIPPEPVTNLVAEYILEQDAICLAWDMVTANDLAIYRVYRSMSSYEEAELLDEVQSTGYCDPTWYQGGGYIYYVEPLDIHDNIGDYVEVDTSDIYLDPLLEATVLDIIESPGTRLLTWQNPTSELYQETCVFRSLSPGVPVDEPIACTTNPYYLETELMLYYYVVSHRDIYGRYGYPSNEVMSQYPTGVTNVPDRVYLLQNTPNPFNPVTTIAYGVAKESRVQLGVYDISGRLVRVLKGGDLQSAGQHEIAWDGQDGSGQPVAAGVYFCRLDAGGFSETKRMTLVK